MIKPMPASPAWLSAPTGGKPLGVDRKARVIRGYVVAQTGDFKSGRGSFDDRSLRMIAEQMNASPAGLKSRFTHPSLSDDGLGKHLGRAKSARIDGGRVRADLHLADAASRAPAGDLAGYVLDLAAEDSDALSSSLVLQPEQVRRLDDRGRPLLDESGYELPPLWYPKRLHASDIVDTGDAVDGLLSSGLSADELPMGELWRADEALNRLFAGQGRDVVESRLLAYLSRYLLSRYGAPAVGKADPVAVLRSRLRALELTSRG